MHAAPIFARIALGLALVGALVLGSEARATLTFPALAIEEVTATPGAKGMLVRINGTFPFEDMVQLPYPLQVFIHQGERFVCYQLPWGVLAGKDEIFEDGLSEEAVARIAQVAKPDKHAKVVQVSDSQIRVQLPDDFPEGTAEVQLFVMYEGAPIFSNAMVVELEDEKW